MPVGAPAGPPPVGRAPLPAVVVALGVTSLLTDVGSEMIFPLLPAFLVGTLGATPAFLGAVEGAADAVSSVLKLVSGRLADGGMRRKPLVVAGYGLAGVARPLMALATAPWHVFAVRFTDRVGKGLRTSPRDALIADTVPAQQAGRAYAFHRAMDHAGAVLGPLLATALLALGLSMRQVFAMAAIPSALALAAVWQVQEPRSSRQEPDPRPGVGGDPAPTTAPSSLRLPRVFRTYLGMVTVFSLTSSTAAFLLLRAQDLGVTDEALPLLWAVLNLARSGSMWALGDFADRFPRPRLVAAGWGIYAVTYAALALASQPWHAWALLGLFGFYAGLCEPAERALVHQLAPSTLRGRAFGWYHFLTGAAALPAGLLTGWLWQTFSPQVALLTGAAAAAACAAGIVLWDRRRTRG